MGWLEVNIRNRLKKDKLKKNLLILINCLPPSKRTLTCIIKYTFFAQFEGFYPSIPKTLRYHGAYSRDIDHLIHELCLEGKLTCSYSKLSTTKLYTLPPHIEDSLPQWADELGIDYERFSMRMQQLTRSIGFRANELGEASRRYFIKILSEPENYFYTAYVEPPSISLPLSLAHLPPTHRPAGCIGYWILKNKEKLPPSCFTPMSEESYTLSPPYVFLGGFFLSSCARELLGGKLFYFTTSILQPEVYRVPLFFPHGGKFWQPQSQLLDNDFIVVGCRKKLYNRSVIEVAGVIVSGRLGESDFLY